MPTVRTTCPSCQTVVVEAADMTLRRRVEADRAEAVFHCPECLDTVVQPLEDRMVPVLLGAGCRVEDWDALEAHRSHPSLTGAITEHEIDDFVRDLNAEGWIDELVRDR